MMMMIMTVPHPQQADEVIQHAFQLFDLPGTGTSLIGYHMPQLTLVTTGANPMEFLMLVIDKFVDLSHSYFQMEI